MIYGYADALVRILRQRSGSEWSIARLTGEQALRVSFRCKEAGNILVPDNILEDAKGPPVETLYKAVRELYEGAHRGPSRWGVEPRASLTCIKCALTVPEPTDAELEDAFAFAENQIQLWAQRAAELRSMQ